MIKKRVQAVALLMVVFVLATSAFPVLATQTVDSLEKQIDEGTGEIGQAKEEKEALENSLDAMQEKKEQLQKTKEKLTDDVIALDHKMSDVTGQLLEIQALLDKKEKEIEQTSAALRQAKEDVDSQYENMKIRIKFMYEHGTMSYLQIIFGAGSFSEMLNKAEYIEQLSEYDRNMLAYFQETKETVTQLEEDLKEQREILLRTQSEVEDKQSEMAGLIADKRNEITDYETDIDNKEKAIEEYEQMIREQDETIKALEAAVAAAKAQKEKAEKERAEREKAEKEKAQNNKPGVSDNDVPSYGGGKFCWPAPSYTRISDDYGYRIHPTLGVEQFHNGVDMAAPSGSSILAAADGVVIAAAYSATMGNYIMIDHGGSLYTIYMHASALYVSNGSSVSKGDLIAAVGSTGRSTGPHLHFSVRLNGSYVSPWGYL